MSFTTSRIIAVIVLILAIVLFAVGQLTIVVAGMFAALAAAMLF